ncbi:MAG: glycosyltransferase [Actinobacteria bacterium]|nr:glycosyltransferase [Actinomycetota bacterium]
MPRLSAATRFVHYHPWLLHRNDSIALVAYQWAQSVVAAGHRAALIGDVVSGHPGGTDESGVEITAVRHIGKGPTLTPLGLGQQLTKDDVLVLHTDWRFANLFAARVARRRGVPYIVVPHGGYERQVLPRVRDPLRYRIPAERHMLRKALGVHVFFETEATIVAEFAPGARFVVAPTGYEVSGEPDWKGGGGYLAWLGRYDIGHKGLDLLMQAVARMPHDDRPKLELHGIDWPDSAAAVSQLAAATGVGDTTTVEAPIFGADKDRFLVESDGFVHAARWESYGLAILENLVRGVPCLVSSACHLALHWSEDPPWVLADPTPAGLERGLRDLLATTPAAAEERCRRGRTLAERDLAWPTVAAQFLAGVDQLLANAGAATP